MSDDEGRGSTPPPPAIQEASADNTIRILLATDNHIGYNERDPIRGQDSINTFKEILQLAVKHDVDFVLLAGDLFHENKPSRECLYQTMALLREYTMGNRPVELELLSDPDEGKAEGYSFPAINYEDPNFNVGIPVFSIHGNHDDPQGAGAEGALCALDVLSVSGLMNYMGKIDLPISDADAQNTGIAVRPVLLRKGTTYLGMYGVGNVKDQRMHFELRSNRVRMFMPRDKDNWFNILLLHQNRVKHGPQESVPEGMFDDSVDLVVWGHEHDCRIVPEPVAGKNYYITQPGSSVATSLADGEAIEKHVALLQIQGKEFEMTPLPLRTVRPFVIEEVVLSEVAEEEGIDLSDQIEISKFLKAKVNALIEQANQLWDERNAKAVEDGEEELPRMLPLVRLKVDTTGVTATSNPIRFGQDFQGRIANPRDVLVFHRSKKSATRSGKVAIDQPELSIDDPNLSVSEKLAKVRVATLVNEYLAAQELQLLGEGGMSDAIQMFVEKDDIHAIQTHVAKSLKVLMNNVQGSEEVDEEEVIDMLVKAKEQQEKDYAENKTKVNAKKDKGKAKAQDDEKSDDSMMMDVDAGAGGSDFEEEPDSDVPPPKKKAPAKPKKAPAKAPAKKAPAKGRGKKAVVSDDDDDEVNEIDDDDDDEEEAPKPTKRTNRAAGLRFDIIAVMFPACVNLVSDVYSQPAKKAPAKKRTTTLAPATAGRSSRAAATKARGKLVMEESIIAGIVSNIPQTGALRTFPFELLTHILEKLCPIFVRQAYGDWGDHGIAEDRLKFDRDLRTYAKLRLVCRDWSAVVAPLLFREAVLITTPSSSPNVILAFLKTRAEHIHSLIILGIPDTVARTSNRANAEAVGRGLGLCARLENLELRGDYAAFINRQWLPKLAPKLASTVTSLVIEGKAREIDIPYALLGLGRSLESLEIISWSQGVPPTSFHMPSRLPNLRHVAIRHGHPSENGHTSENVRRFFSRLTADKANNPLRSLHLTEIGYNSPPNFIQILKINCLGVRLTSFHLTAGTCSRNSTFIVEAMCLCPNLEDVSFGFQAPHKDVLDHLPKRISSLEISAVYHYEWDTRPENVIKLLENKQCPLLRHLKLFLHGSITPELASICLKSHIQWETGSSGVYKWLVLLITVPAQ
ncbi:hypothetical protein DXG01_008947 [Tephrocybe rancida]|nr:hypothetical protein DXG01_008947 [Tephrocybe rancida]